MKTYVDKLFSFHWTKISLINDDKVFYEKKTLFGHRKSLHSLTLFSPEAIENNKPLSNDEKFGLFAVLATAIAIMVAYSKFPEKIDWIPTIYGMAAVVLLLISALIYYFLAIRKVLLFHHYNGMYLYLYVRIKKMDNKQKQFIKYFANAVRVARINYSKKNIKRLEAGIDSLQKQAIINTEFANQLRERVSAAVGTEVN